MPSKWIQQCPGFATYRWHDNGGIEIKGSGFDRYPDSHRRAKNIKKFWSKYNTSLVKYAKKFKLPVSWVVAIVAIESGGDEWACSPCVKIYKGKQWCSFAPNCGGGVASDGKTYSCCAYGLMQAINSEAVKRGYKSGADLLGNPDASIGVGVDVYREKLGYAKGDPVVACRMYNGCGSCKNGRAPCPGEGIFGIGGQGNYAEAFALSVNTFLAMELPAVEPTDPDPGTEPTAATQTADSSPLYKVGMMGLFAGATYWFLTKRKLI